MTSRFRRQLHLAMVATLVLNALLSSACLQPPLQVRRVPGGVDLDMRTLGDYQTSIARIRLSDEHGRIVWETVAKGSPVPQIFEVKLRCGRNPARIPEEDDYTVRTPAGSDTFILHGREEYTVEVWGVDKLMRARSSFSLGNCR